jgi:hypothetical protein
MKKKMGYDRSTIKKFDAINWSEIMPRLIKYARSKESILTKVCSELRYSDLLQEAIARVYGQGKNGKYRNWDSVKYPDLAIFLIFIMKEIVHREIATATTYKKEQLCWDAVPGEERELSIENYDSVDKQHSSNPEYLIIEKESIERLSDRLEVISDEDEELGLVLLCIFDGKTKSSQIAEETDLPIEKVYNLKRKLKRRLNCYNEIQLDGQ